MGTIEETSSSVFTEFLNIQVLSSAEGGNILYKLVMPLKPAVLSVATAGPNSLFQAAAPRSGPGKRVRGLSFDEIDLPGLHERYGEDAAIYSQWSSRQLIFELPRDVSPAGIYELLADFLSEKLDEPELGIMFNHVCPHCSHDASELF